MVDRIGQSALQSLSSAGIRRTYAPPVQGGGSLALDLNWNSGIAVPKDTNGYIGFYNTGTSAPSGFTREATNTQVFSGVDNPGSPQSHHVLLTRKIQGNSGDFRVELDGAKTFPNFTPIWYGFAVYVKSTTNYPQQVVCFQTHHRNTPAEDQVPFALTINELSWAMFNIFHEDAYSTAAFPNRKLTTYKAGSSLGPAFHTLTFNVWTRWVINITFDYLYSRGANNIGRVQMWKNGIQVADIPFAIGIGKFQEANGVFVENQTNTKMGIYTNQTEAAFNPSLATIELFFSRFRVAVGANRYADVAP